MITAYIITDIHSKFSTALAQQTQHCLQQYDWNYRIWPAVNGFELTDQSWLKLGITLLDRGKTLTRPGAWGCIHSHFTLWQHCVQLGEPIVVLEHDALAQGEFPCDLDLEVGVCKLWSSHNIRHNTITGTWSRGSWAYTLTPGQAKTLIEFSRSQGVQALDKQLGTRAVAWQALDWDLFQHNPSSRWSSTVFRTYIG
jgi:GR25 family glycosyltransferase involved in LPS biosynthesis